MLALFSVIAMVLAKSNSIWSGEQPRCDRENGRKSVGVLVSIGGMALQSAKAIDSPSH